jgi:hypothetical protein
MQLQDNVTEVAPRLSFRKTPGYADILWPSTMEGDIEVWEPNPVNPEAQQAGIKVQKGPDDQQDTRLHKAVWRAGDNRYAACPKT